MQYDYNDCFAGMDGRMTCEFTSFSTVFHSYQDDGRLIMKGCVPWNSVYGSEDFAVGIELGPLDQLASA